MERVEPGIRDFAGSCQIVAQMIRILRVTFYLSKFPALCGTLSAAPFAAQIECA